jgi:succinate dehydrogenase / fumarate reductase cytochrome b subunit
MSADVMSSRLSRFWASTVGKKIVMAATGLIMAGFLVVHMTGNMLAFLGASYINDYSHFLHAVPEVLWPARAVLLLSVVLHATAAWQLARIKGEARPVGYERFEPQVATLASRTIRWFSLLVALFIVIHLLHFTTGTLLPGFVDGDPYTNLVTAFRTQRGMAAFYLVMMIVIGLHLYHGTWSAIRTLGLSRPRPNPLVRPVATILAVGLWLGFSAVPLGVLTGVLTPADDAPALTAVRR